MRGLILSNGNIQVELTRWELYTINGCITNALDFGTEFQTRVGATSDEAEVLLESLLSVSESYDEKFPDWKPPVL